jgi:hypothetical protein
MSEAHDALEDGGRGARPAVEGWTKDDDDELDGPEVPLVGDSRLKRALNFEEGFWTELKGSSTLIGAGIFLPLPFSLIPFPNDRVDETARAIFPIGPPPRLSSKEGGEHGGRGKNIVLSGLGMTLLDADVDADPEVNPAGKGTPRRGL